MSLRVCVAFGVGVSLTVGVLAGLAYYAANLWAGSFTTTKPGAPRP